MDQRVNDIQLKLPLVAFQQRLHSSASVHIDIVTSAVTSSLRTLKQIWNLTNIWGKVKSPMYYCLGVLVLDCDLDVIKTEFCAFAKCLVIFFIWPSGTVKQ